MDVIIVPFAVFFSVLVVLMWILVPDAPWVLKLWFALLAFHLLVGRFFVKWFQKARTLYVVTEWRALVLRNGRIFEEESLEGVKPEVAGWGKNKIVTFGDVTLSGADSMIPNRIIEGNSGLFPSSLVIRRGDITGYPIRFYDLEPASAERLMAILTRSGRDRRISEEDLSRQADQAASSLTTDYYRPAADDEQATTLSELLSEGSHRPARFGRLRRWSSAKPWRFVLLPAFGAIAVIGLVSAVAHVAVGWAVPAGLVTGGLFYALHIALDGHVRR